MRTLKRLTIAGIVVIFVLSLFDAWKVTNTLRTSALIALAPTLIVSGAYLAAAYFGRTSGRQLLLGVGASSICLVGLVVYVGYAMAGHGNPDTASQLHVLFFPALLGLLAFVVMAVCVAVAFVRPPNTKPGGAR